MLYLGSRTSGSSGEAARVERTDEIGTGSHRDASFRTYHKTTNFEDAKVEIWSRKGLQRVAANVLSGSNPATAMMGHENGSEENDDDQDDHDLGRDVLAMVLLLALMGVSAVRRKMKVMSITVIVLMVVGDETTHVRAILAVLHYIAWL